MLGATKGHTHLNVEPGRKTGRESKSHCPTPPATLLSRDRSDAGKTHPSRAANRRRGGFHRSLDVSHFLLGHLLLLEPTFTAACAILHRLTQRAGTAPTTRPG